MSKIYNNIIGNNSASSGADLYLTNDGDGNNIPSSIFLFNNDFDQSPAGTYIQIPFAIDPSNRDNADPLFVDPSGGDFHLQATSPCINAGTNDAPNLPTTDKDDLPRIVGGIVDIGAYEYQGLIGPIMVTVDIKPGSDPNSINPKSRGKIPVAIFSTEAFDARRIVDLNSLAFGPTGDEGSLAFCNPGGEDINEDGLLDLVCHFFTQTADFQCGDTQGILKGITTDGTRIEGRDSVRINPCK